MSDYFADTPLENKLGLTDTAELKAAEEKIVTEKTAQLLLRTLPKQFDFAFLLHIHQTLFEDIYDFAGKIRIVDIAKPESATPFAHAEFIVSEGQRIFAKLKKQRYLVDLDREKFIEEIASLSADLNALHPFREGNGRTIRLFLILLSENAGFLMDFSAVQAGEIIEADKQAFAGNNRKLLEIYHKIVVA